VEQKKRMLAHNGKKIRPTIAPNATYDDNFLMLNRFTKGKAAKEDKSPAGNATKRKNNI
jgi:hypothetical protein